MIRGGGRGVIRDKGWELIANVMAKRKINNKLRLKHKPKSTYKKLGGGKMGLVNDKIKNN